MTPPKSKMAAKAIPRFSVLADVAIRGAKLALNAEATHVQSFALKLVKGGTIQIPERKIPAGLQLPSLTMHLDRKPVVSKPESEKKLLVPSVHPVHQTQPPHAQPVHSSPLMTRAPIRHHPDPHNSESVASRKLVDPR